MERTGEVERSSEEEDGSDGGVADDTARSWRGVAMEQLQSQWASLVGGGRAAGA